MQDSDSEPGYEEAPEVLSGAPGSLERVEGSNYSILVELLILYSNPSISAQKLTGVGLAAAKNVVSRCPPVPGSRQVRLGGNEVGRLVEAYQDGALIKDLAVRFGVHRTTVTLVLRRAGVDLRPVGLSEKQVNHAGQLYESGWTLAKLAAEFDVDDMTIWRSLKKIGVAMRSPHSRRHQ